jgi:hypothetical protein
VLAPRALGTGVLRGREYAEQTVPGERITPFGVWRWEISSGRVRWSDALHHIYGLAPGEFAGTVEGFHTGHPASLAPTQPA